MVLLFTVLLKDTNSLTGMCGDLEGCRCDDKKDTVKLTCNLNKRAIFDFGLMDLKNISDIEILGDNILMRETMPPVSYSNIRSIHIEGNQHNSTISQAFLRQFPNIQYLCIRKCNVTHVEPGAFQGLSKLLSLDLSANGNLAYKVVEEGLVNFNSPLLKLVNLSSIHKPDISGSFPFGEITVDLLKWLANTSLEILDISWSRVYYLRVSWKYIPHLKSLNFSGTGLLGSPACISTALSMENLTELIMDYWPYTEKSGLVETYPKPRYKLSVSDQCELVPYSGSDGCYRVPQSLRTLQVQFLELTSLYYDFNKPMCFQTNNMVNFLGAGVILPRSFLPTIRGLDNLLVFDISYPQPATSESEFPGPVIKNDFFQRMPLLEVILIPGTRLGAMHSSNLTHLFSTNIHLEVLDISTNNLTEIPREMFKNNSALRLLNISNNGLITFDLEYNTLSRLKVLDLSFNQLKTLTTELVDSLNFNNNLQNFMLSQNNFPCDCSINNILSLNVTYLQLTCDKANGGIEIAVQNKTFPYACQSQGKEHAQLPREVLILIILIPILALGVLVGVLIVCRRKRAKRVTTENRDIPLPVVHFVKAVDVDTTVKDRDFLVFIAYSHHDCEFVCIDLVPKLDNALKQLFPEHKGDILCLYDKHFLPGYRIDEVIEQAVLNSYVVVAIITKAFLDSDWCGCEIQMAFSNHVPVIPLYLVECNPKDYKGIFKMMFEEKVRLKWPVRGIEGGDDGTYHNAAVQVPSKSNSDDTEQASNLKENTKLSGERDAVINKLSVAIYSYVKNIKGEQ